MNLKASVNVDVGGSVKGAADTAAKAKAEVSGNVSSAIGGTKDAAGAMKDKATTVVESAKSAASDAANAIKDKANAAMDAAKEKAAEMKEQCSAAKSKFKNAVTPPDGWKPTFATTAQISIGKDFSSSKGITLRKNEWTELKRFPFSI